jgi:hypothetical protein
MREYIFDAYTSVMDHNKNPLRHIKDFNTRHFVTQVLAWMWCITFSIMVGSWTVFGYTAIAHLIFVAAIFITVATFETAKRSPDSFKFIKGYHTYGRGRDYVMYRDKDGMPYKVSLPKGDPGGEHE